MFLQWKFFLGFDSNDDETSSANDNFIVNSLQDTCTFEQADVGDHMKKCIEEQKILM